MDTINFQQSLGFPFDTDILNFMQKSYSLFNALGAVVGDLSIIKGCTTDGTIVSDGVVYINGEILNFKGGLIDTNVVIVEEKTALEFEDNETRDVEFVRYATFGGGTTQWAWSNFKRGMPTVDVAEALAGKATQEALNTLASTVNTMLTKLNTIDTNAKVQVNTDWNATSGFAQLLNKPDFSTPFLKIGSYPIGDVVGSDNIRTVTFADLGTANYFVLGGLRSNSPGWDIDNDVMWSWRETTATSFKLLLREVSGNFQDLTFFYVLIAI